MNPVQRIARHPWVYRWFVLAQQPLIERIESVLRWITRNRFGVLDLAGLPCVQITVPGRRSGLARTTTVQYVPDREGMLLVGSNWGRPDHPSWAANLQSARQARVRCRGEEFIADVQPLTGHHRDTAWNTIVTHWPNYAIAQDLAAHRRFRLFMLTPATAEEPQRALGERA